MSERRSRLFLWACRRHEHVARWLNKSATGSTWGDKFRIPICSITEQRWAWSLPAQTLFIPSLARQRVPSLLPPTYSRFRPPLRLFWVDPVVSSEVFELMSATGSMKRWLPILRSGFVFTYRWYISICIDLLSFWLQPIRDNLAVSWMTQFNQQLSLCSPFHLFPSCS